MDDTYIMESLLSTDNKDHLQSSHEYPTSPFEKHSPNEEENHKREKTENDYRD